MGARAGHGDWDEQYAGDTPPPWQIGRVQPAFAELISTTRFADPILDVGCGTGELALALASKGHRVIGIDCAERALAEARRQAAARGLDITFAAADAEHLQDLDLRPRTVVDCGLLHNLDHQGRRRYLAGLQSICDTGSAVYVEVVSGEAGAGWDLSEHDLADMFRAPAWCETAIGTVEVVAIVAGEELSLPGFLVRTIRGS